MKFNLPYKDGWVAYSRARREHAWLLKAEGLDLRQIGKRLGTNAIQARWMVWDMGRNVASAIENATWTFHDKAYDEQEDQRPDRGLPA